MPQNHDFGRISPAEYGARLNQLERLADEAAERGEPQPVVDRWLRLAELNLMIDLRLGIDFPAEDRHQIAEAVDEADTQRNELASQVITGLIAAEQVPAAAQQIADHLHNRLSEILSPALVTALFGETHNLPFPPAR